MPYLALDKVSEAVHLTVSEELNSASVISGGMKILQDSKVNLILYSIDRAIRELFLSVQVGVSTIRADCLGGKCDKHVVSPTLLSFYTSKAG